MEINRTVLIRLIIILFVFQGFLFGAVENGGVYGPIMKDGIGGKGAGLGGAYTSIADDGTSPIYNPAGVNYIQDNNIITANYSSSMIGLGNILYFSYIGNIKGAQKIGVSFIWQGFDNLEVYSYNQTKGGLYSLTYLQIGLTSAIRIFKNFDIGFTVKFFYSNIDTYSINSLDADIGIMYSPFKNFRVGLTCKNIVPLGYKFIQEKEDLPADIKLGVSYRLQRYHLLFAYDIEKYLEPDFAASSFIHHFGMEYDLYKYLQFVAGYDLNNFTFGLAINLSQFSFYSGTVRNTSTGNINFGVSYKIRRKKDTEVSMDYFYQGTVAYQNKDYRTAIKYFQKVLDLRYDSTAEFYLNNSKSYLESEEWMSEEEKAMVGMKLELAQKYIEQSLFGKAINTLREVLNINSENETAKKMMTDVKNKVKISVEEYYKKAMKFFKVNNYQESLKNCNLALDLNPEHKPSLKLKEENESILKDTLTQQRREEQKKTEAETLFQQGLISYQNANWIDAKNNFKKSYELVKSKETLNYLKKTEERLKELKLTEKSKKESFAHLNAGKKLYEKKKLKLALQEFETAVNLYPDNTEAVQQLEKLRSELDAIINGPLEAGKADLRNGKLASAIDNFKKVLKVDPNNKVAKKFLNKAKSLVKDAISYNLKFAKSSFKKKQYSDALGYYREVIKLDAKNKEAKNGIKLCQDKLNAVLKKHFNYGIVFFNKKDYVKALKEFKDALEIDSEYLPAKDMLEKTKKFYEKNKTQIDLAQNIKDGMDYFYNKNYEQARVYFKKALAIDPNNAKAKKYLKKCEDNLQDLIKQEKIAKIITDGLIFYRKKKFDKAIKEWIKVKQIDPGNKTIDEYIQYAKRAREESLNKNYNKGIEYFNKGDYLKAKLYLQKALETNPNHSKAKKKLLEVNSIIFTKVTEKKQLGKRAFRKGDYDTAISDFDYVLKIEPENDEFKDRLAQAKKAKAALNEGKKLMEKGDYANAIEKFTMVLDYNSKDSTAKRLMNESLKEGKKQSSKWFNDGMAYYKNGDLKKAQSRFSSVLKADPSHTEAKNMLNKIEKVINNKCSSFYNTAVSYYRSKNYKAAIKNFREILKLKNKYKDTSILLAKSVKIYNKSTEKDRKKLKQKIQEYLYSGIKFYRNGKLKEAIVEWKKVLKISPNHSKAIKYINRAKYKLSQLEKIK